jgi:hypothetical protein
MLFEEIIAKVNEVLEFLGVVAYEENQDIRLIEFGGIKYQPCDFTLGSPTPNSIAAAQVNCLQVPSAEDFTFDVSEEFVRKYLTSLHPMVDYTGDPIGDTF